MILLYEPIRPSAHFAVVAASAVRDVKFDRVAEDEIAGIRNRNVLRRPPHYDSKLTLPVDFFATLRHDDIVVRSHDNAR